MFSKSHLTLLVAATVASFGVATNAYSEVITYVGSVTDTSSTAGVVTSWRTSTVAKTLQLNGNNVYGSTLGANDWNQGTVGEVAVGSGLFGWSQGTDSTNTNYGATSGYDAVDVPTAAPSYTSGSASAGLVYNNGGTASVTFGLEGTQADYTGKVVRVGIMQNLFSGSYATGSTDTLVMTGPNSSTSPVETVAATNGIPNMYFFDITGITAGDQFSITSSTSATGQPGIIGPVSFDIASVPEPATLGLLAIGGLGLLLIGRKHKRLA